jgi:rhodanese-related sulfurtransferase
MSQLTQYLGNHPILAAATAVAVVAVGAMEWYVRRRAATELSIPEAVRMINNGAVVVDVRDQAAYDAGHIADAIHTSPADLLKSVEARLKKKRGVLVVCDTGAISHGCADRLQKAGYEGAFSLRGGLAAWVRESQPLVVARSRA